MIKNDEPDGCPYVVANGDYLDLQIYEVLEIDMVDEKQGDI